MSNSLSIAAVTATLQLILTDGFKGDPNLNGTRVTILPLDKARDSATDNQLNLFLYQIQRNPAWVNADMPRQVQPGEIAISPLPLNLYYILTPFGRDNDTFEPWGHALLGKAMSIMHDFPVLSATDIKNATSTTLLQPSDLDQQLEHVRITLQPLSVEEYTKLWTGFASQYRLSAAYEAAVTLIESTRSARAPLPVLTRGQNDSGVSSQADLTPPFPTLMSVTPPNQQPSARLNDVIQLTGVNLDGTNQTIQFNHPLWTVPVELTPQAGSTSTQMSVAIPPQPTVWPAGIYSVAVFVQRPNETFRRSTNQLAMSLAPAITIAPGTAPGPNISYQVTSSPQVWPGQSATLMLGDQEIPAAEHPNQTATLTFAATNLAAGAYWTRLRIDGVDSLLVNRSVTPPMFDQTQQVTVQ
jgi:hypothetical protein